jgi:hypothetical protein
VLPSSLRASLFVPWSFASVFSGLLLARLLLRTPDFPKQRGSHTEMQRRGDFVGLSLRLLPFRPALRSIVFVLDRSTLALIGVSSDYKIEDHHSIEDAVRLLHQEKACAVVIL